MKICEKCHVQVRGSSVCPLCGSPLEGEPELPIYPKLSRKISGMGMLLRIMLMGTVSAGVICLAMNGMLPETGSWSWYVILGIASFWICFFLLCRHRKRLPRMFTEQAFILWLLCLFWDGITGWGGWSPEWMGPILFSAAQLTLFIVCPAKKIPPQEYVVCQCLNALMGIFPALLYLAGGIHFGVPALISASLGGITLLFIFLFDMTVLRRELSRRLHL